MRGVTVKLISSHLTQKVQRPELPEALSPEAARPGEPLEALSLEEVGAGNPDTLKAARSALEHGQHPPLSINLPDNLDPPAPAVSLAPAAG